MPQIPVYLFVFTLINLISSSYSQENTYPTDERLFHIERSKNRNLVCYDVKLNPDGEWKTSDPVKVYWVNREETPGKMNGLSAIQKKLAYGYKLKSHGEDSCVIALNACSDRPITVKKEEKKYCCRMIINGLFSELKSVYVKAQDGNSLKVEYVELVGKDLKTGNSTSEKIYK